jgi:DNA polymerase-3 subunit gamma/tau
VSGRRKVYILDEAHMLSTAAWNAFLKTLEEPPPNTVFVLATTEATKVPATVVDRCHRFDFQRPTVEQIASVVRRAAQAESIEIPPAAVAALARSATGSFRDALGTLEQLVTYSGREIALPDVLAVLGVADSRLVEETIDAVAASDARRALTAMEECAQQGRDAGSFAADLEVRARDLLVVQTLGEMPEELSLTPEADAALQAQATRVEHGTVVRLLELLGEAMEAVRAGADARTRLELALVKAARPEVDGSLRALLMRIERLERGGQAPSPPPAAAPSEGSAAGPVPAAAPAPVSAAVPSPAPPAPPGDALAEATPPPISAPKVEVARPQDCAEPQALTHDLASLSAMWPAVVDLVRREHAMLGAVIAAAKPVAVDGEDLTLAFASTAQFLKKKAENPANRAAVGEALRALTGARWRLSYELSDEPGAEPGLDEASEEDWVRRFMEEFDAEEIPVESDARGEPRGADDEQPVTSNEKGA